MITVIGCDGSPLPPAARSALERAALVVGARRHLRAAQVPAGARTVVMGDVDEALDAVASALGETVVLASGDPGFFGILRRLRQRGLRPDRVLPAVSSVAAAFARAGECWDDAIVVSAHGRDARPAVNACRAVPKVAVLTEPRFGPAQLGAALAGEPRTLLVAERLGAADERVTLCTPEQAAARADWADPNVVLVFGPDASLGAPRDVAGLPATPAGWALPEREFDHRDSMVTKAEVRALALARLGPGVGRLVWDVGAGSGSVSVECARFGAAVCAVERDDKQCARIAANARRHGVAVRVVPGVAPAVLAGLPDPDAAFVGGGGTACVAAVAARRPARVVVALAAVERIGPVTGALVDGGYDVDGVLLQAARLAPLPAGDHRLAAANPVVLVCGTLP